jgi:hypothetical protein
MCRKTEDTGIITLSKITQAHKDKYHIFSHMWNSAGQKDMKVKGGDIEGEKGEGAEDKRRYQRGE